MLIFSGKKSIAASDLYGSDVTENGMTEYWPENGRGGMNGR